MSERTQQAKAALDAAKTRVEELGARLQEVTAEEETLPARIAQAATSREVETLSARRAELTRLRGDLWRAVESARIAETRAKEEYARHRIPEVVENREVALGLLAKHLAAAIETHRESAALIAGYEGELQTLNPPAGMARPDNPHLLDATHVFRAAFDVALKVDPAGVEVVALRSFKDDRVLGRRLVNQGERLSVSHPLAAVLKRDGLVEEVERARA